MFNHCIEDFNLKYRSSSKHLHLYKSSPRTFGFAQSRKAQRSQRRRHRPHRAFTTNHRKQSRAPSRCQTTRLPGGSAGSSTTPSSDHKFTLRLYEICPNRYLVHLVFLKDSLCSSLLQPLLLTPADSTSRVKATPESTC